MWSVDESRCRRWRAVSRLLRFVLRYITMPTRDACTRRRRAHNLRINDYKLHNYFELLGRLRALAQHHSIFNILRLCYCNFCSKLNCVNNTTLLRPSILIVKNHRMRRARVYYYKLLGEMNINYPLFQYYDSGAAHILKNNKARRAVAR